MTTIVIRFNVKMHKSFFQKIIMVFVKFQFSSFCSLIWVGSEGKFWGEMGVEPVQDRGKTGVSEAQVSLILYIS